MDVKIGTIVIDSNDPERLARFWGKVTGRRARHEDGSPYTSLSDPRGREPELVLQKVSEPKVGKNRVHFDLYAQNVDAAAERLVAAGATLQSTQHDHGGTWLVMQDPDGNEFCIIPVDQAEA